jgi:FkbM family methyltransferase
MVLKSLAKNIYRNIPFKKGLFSLIRFCFVVPELVYKHLYFCGVFSIKTEKTNFKMRHYGYVLENELFWRGISGCWENKSMQLWIKLSKLSNTIVDVGANTGVYALIAKTVNHKAEVFAFEPVNKIYEKLLDNCKLNNYAINCFDSAASNRDGHVKIYLASSEHAYAVSLSKSLTSSGTAVFEQETPTVKLSTFIEQNKIKKIDLMKIDVETHEPEVLEGMEEYLKQMHPAMLIEVLNDEAGSRIERILSGLEYLYFNINEKSGSVIRTNHILRSQTYNYLVCNKETALKLGLS